ncbi:hypothetical protein PROVRETT_09478 [Providencia rettgeri DSM 1131]|uniref:hypothetical protein n=1 Tax=Providencia rettgeri TaxID=587 RepID=UPI000197C715|nr:hypothetical protein [Providencia rettgeri]EFE51750.1 hypothetical protein PROVRETT_09478 [Providencia rettgeri DSM 1131]QXA58868.1 hypothetical protein I6L79_04760 [Providencia rettgeri]
MKKIMVLSVFTLLIFPITMFANINETESFLNLSFTCIENQSFNVIFINSDEDDYAVVGWRNQLIPMELIPTTIGNSYRSISENEVYTLQVKGSQAEIINKYGVPILSGCTILQN